jgi:hypothetical protein
MELKEMIDGRAHARRSSTAMPPAHQGLLNKLSLIGVAFASFQVRSVTQCAPLQQL